MRTHTPLIDQLGDDDAAKTLAFARLLLDVHRAQARLRGSPRAHGPCRRSIGRRRLPVDGLRAALFGPEESVTAFDDTIRRWREEPESV